MNAHFWFELLGYTGSVFILISFLMSNIIKLRIINTIGCVITIIYSLIVKAYPVALMNVCLIIINLYYIWKLKKSDREYQAVFTNQKDGSVQYLLDTYGEDIQKHWPTALQKAIKNGNLTCIVYAEGTPAALWIGDVKDGKAEVLLDYAMPAYRDTSAGKFLYEILPSKGITEIFTTQQDSGSYFQHMGFTKGPEGLTKTLKS